jgi:geranylgeranyl pyrophosphate synthase
LLWRDAPDKALSPLEALKIYALKTSPAFEAALYAGVRLAGPIDNYEKLVSEFCKNLGVAFQILNDLKDWEGDADNKLVSGQDVLGGRPTLLMALALEGANANHRKQLLDIFGQTNRDPATVEIVRDIYARTQVFDKAEKLVEKFKAKCEALADETQPTEFRELLYFLVDNVLERTPPEEPHHEHEHHHDQGHHHHGHGHGHGGLVQLGIVARSR